MILKIAGQRVTGVGMLHAILSRTQSILKPAPLGAQT
jgi:hypothetical protein